LRNDRNERNQDERYRALISSKCYLDYRRHPMRELEKLAAVAQKAGLNIAVQQFKAA
jgi:hypothetical protein